MTVTEALRRFCADAHFEAYLEVVSLAAGLSKKSLLKGAAAVLSETIHAGSTHASVGNAVPQSVLRDKSALYAVAAIFKLSRRDARFYVGSPAGVLKLPLPLRWCKLCSMRIR